MNWIRETWNSTEALYTWSYRFQIAAALLTLPIFALTGLTALITNRKDKLDQLAGIESAKAIASANERAALANQRAGQAEEKAADANQKAAEANQAAAGMNAQAKRFEAAAEASALETARIQTENIEIQRALERERIARLELEARMAPRSLSPSQKATLKAKLAQLRGTPIKFVSLTTHEPASFAKELKEVFSSAGLAFEDIVRMVPVVPRGVVVGAPHSLDPQARVVALALMEAGVAGVMIELAQTETMVSIHVLEKP